MVTTHAEIIATLRSVERALADRFIVTRTVVDKDRKTIRVVYRRSVFLQKEIRK